MQVFDTRANKVRAREEADVSNESALTENNFIHNNKKEQNICNSMQKFQGNKLVTAHIH